MIEGRCICGGVTVELPRAPEYLNACNCRLCQRSGGIWGYFPRDEVTIRGETRRFVRSDLDEAYLANLFCPTCGNAAAWIALDSGYPRMGVNMRLFEPDALRGIETRFPDGLGWAKEAEGPAFVHEPAPYGGGRIL